MTDISLYYSFCNPYADGSVRFNSAHGNLLTSSLNCMPLYVDESRDYIMI